MIKPFLKWAGSKTKLLPIIKSYSEVRDVFVEPFAGSGVVFLNMSGYKKYYVYDINPDLINLYQTLKSEGESFISLCESYFIPENNIKERYYELRKEFNTIKENGSKKRAALFVYLNRHCFNGLCRYNLSGDFNVPMGKYSKPYFPKDEMQQFYEKSQFVEFINDDFRVAFQKANSFDSCLIYCDPPYVNDDLNKNEGFTSYAKDSFSLKDQEDLANCAKETKHLCLISNHATDFTRSIYSNSQLIEFGVKRQIAANKQDRREARELLAVFNNKND